MEACFINFSPVLNSTFNSIRFSSADVWIYPSSDWNRVAEQKVDYLSQFKSVQNEEVYDYQMSGENSWFEQRLAEYGKNVMVALRFISFPSLVLVFVSPALHFASLKCIMCIFFTNNHI